MRDCPYQDGDVCKDLAVGYAVKDHTFYMKNSGLGSGFGAAVVQPAEGIGVTNTNPLPACLPNETTLCHTGMCNADHPLGKPEGSCETTCGPIRDPPTCQAPGAAPQVPSPGSSLDTGAIESEVSNTRCADTLQVSLNKNECQAAAGSSGAKFYDLDNWGTWGVNQKGMNPTGCYKQYFHGYHPIEGHNWRSNFYWNGTTTNSIGSQNMDSIPLCKLRDNTPASQSELNYAMYLGYKIDDNAKSDCSTDPLVPITQKNDCENAANALGYRFLSTDYYQPKIPTGCSRNKLDNDVYFNTHPGVGWIKKEDKFESICRERCGDVGAYCSMQDATHDCCDGYECEEDGSGEGGVCREMVAASATPTSQGESAGVGIPQCQCDQDKGGVQFDQYGYPRCWLKNTPCMMLNGEESPSGPDPAQNNQVLPYKWLYCDYYGEKLLDC